MRIVTSSLAAAALLATTSASAEVTANVGFMSNYVFRGVEQNDSSAMGGVDFDHSGFYLGIWSADVGKGLEIDYYGGYGFEVGEFSFGVGGTIYTYTGDFDDNYLEANVGISWEFLSFDAAFGRYDSDPSQDYQFYSVTASHNGFYGTIGTFADDFDGTYYEAGYGSDLTVEDTYLFDYGISIIHSNSTLLGGESDTNINFQIMRTFSF